jgi:hypothetical protein
MSLDAVPPPGCTAAPVLYTTITDHTVHILGKCTYSNVIDGHVSLSGNRLSLSITSYRLPSISYFRLTIVANKF